MSTRFMTSSGIAVAGLSLWTQVASAGWVIDQETKGREGHQQVSVQSNRMKTVMLTPDGKPLNGVIIEADTKTITLVDYQQQQYISATTQEYVQVMKEVRQALAPKLAEAMKKMKEAMKDKPPEQRAAMEQMMKSQMAKLQASPQDCPEPPKVEVRKTEQKETISGYPAVRYDVLSDGKPQSEVWITKDISVWKDFDPQKLQEFSADMAKMTACGGERGRGGILGSDPIFKLASEGYPVRTIDHGGSDVTVEVVKAENKSVAATEFQPPSGFARKTLQEMVAPAFKGTSQ